MTYKDEEINKLYESILVETGIRFEFRWDRQRYGKPIRCFEWRLSKSSLPWQIAQLPFGFEGDEVEKWVELFKTVTIPRLIEQSAEYTPPVNGGHLIKINPR
jgi:hypothetical protein